MIKLYNTLSRKIEEFKPKYKNKLSIYVCGPTVYSDIHIGNARPVIFFDVLRNYFEYLGYEVKYVSNITDIDDKIISEAKKLNIKEQALTEKYTKNFIAATKKVNSKLPTLMPKATNYIGSMIAYIKELLDKGFAYQTKTGVYFRTANIKDYGVLSGQNANELARSVRIENKEDKEDFRDFSLWKVTNDGLAYDSPFGIGRPGWHTECAVMNDDIFGEEIDIHGGGSDLIFPHHENEIAQTKAHSNHGLARYWMHVGRLDLDDEKMSKSIGNTILVKDLLEPTAFRLLVLGHHYRSPINYSDELLLEYVNNLDRINRTIKRSLLKINEIKNDELNVELINDFKNAMNEDLNTAKVLAIVLEAVKNLNSSNDLNDINQTYNSLIIILNILGLNSQIILTNDIINLHKQWLEARANKEYELADKLRVNLIEEGWI